MCVCGFFLLLFAVVLCLYVESVHLSNAELVQKDFLSFVLKWSAKSLGLWYVSPGHTYSWGLSRPELLTQCYSGSSPVKGYLGPIDPVHNSTYRFLKTLFGEILHVFKDQYIHLGGDEVPLGCW